MNLYIYLAAAIALTLIWSLIKGIAREKRERAHHQSLDTHRPTWGYTNRVL